jgi:type 1 glutamine amidotransferase
LLLVAVLFVAPPSLLAEDAKPKINVLILTDRGFDRVNFYKMFEDMPSVKYETAVLPRDMDLLAPGLEKKYDLILSCDMNNSPQVTDEQRENFAKLIRSGMPLIVLHHSICGHDDWPHYWQMVGGKFPRRIIEVDGVVYQPGTYKYDLDIAVEVVDREHPITKGIENFVIRDEGYKGLYIRAGIHLLLRTDHPDATPELAWTTMYGKGPIFVNVLGHDRHAYENPNIRRQLYQGIHWGVKKKKKNSENPNRQ